MTSGLGMDLFNVSIRMGLNAMAKEIRATGKELENERAPACGAHWLFLNLAAVE